MLKLRKSEMENALHSGLEFGRVYYAKNEGVRLHLNEKQEREYNIPIMFLKKDGEYFIEVPDYIARKLKLSKSKEWDVEIDDLNGIDLRLI